MIVYIAGPITGVPDYRARFETAANRFRAMGCSVLSPAWLPDGLPYEACMRIDAAMIAEADLMALLPGWPDSPGTQRELRTAVARDTAVLPLERALECVAMGRI